MAANYVTGINAYVSLTCTDWQLHCDSKTPRYSHDGNFCIDVDRFL